jgi:hypothetical protein
VLGWFAYGRGVQVPLLSNADLGFHELGHMLAAPLPTMVMFLAGSAAQVLIPLSLAGYFGIARRDPAAAGVMLAWAGSSAQDVSVYVADAPHQSLPLIGGQHDWAYLLGPNGWDAMASAGTLASVVKIGGGLVLFAGFLLCLIAAIEASGLAQPRPIRVRRDAPVQMRPARYRPRDGVVQLPTTPEIGDRP